jgi:hypothetical protein
MKNGGNMKEVNQKEFFKALNNDSRDIMPTIIGKYPYTSEWRTNNINRVLFGKSAENKYWLVKEATI